MEGGQDENSIGENADQSQMRILEKYEKNRSVDTSAADQQNSDLIKKNNVKNDDFPKYT